MRGESSFLENPNVRNFLVNNETTLFNGSATLRQAAFQLVSDMELLRIKCPFVFGKFLFLFYDNMDKLES